MEKSESFWEAWERLRSSSNPDPLEVLHLAVTFKNYFGEVEREAIGFARASGRTWEQIAEALGQSRQAVWQRANRDAELQSLLNEYRKRHIQNHFEALHRDPISWYEKTKPFSV
jgi:hypothetical protein